MLGSITGESLDLGVVDDPIKGRAEANSELQREKVWHWLTDDVFSRFSEKAGLLMIMTRWHFEASVRLENNIIIMRWRMLRGETDDVALTLYDAKKHMREMKQHFERLQYRLDKIYDEAEAARALKVVAETAA